MKNTFEKTLREHRDGHAVEELSEKLADLVAAVRLTGRQGDLQLTLRVKPASRGNTDTLMVEDKITLRAPQPDRGASVFFATDQNLLQRDNPRQQMMKLEPVPAPAPLPEALPAPSTAPIAVTR